MQVECWDLWSQECVQEQRYAACPCAEVEDPQRAGAGGVAEEEGAEVCGNVFGFRSVVLRSAMTSVR